MQWVAGAAGTSCRDVELRLGLLPLQQLVLLLLRFVVRQADTAPRWRVWPVTCRAMQLAQSHPRRRLRYHRNFSS